MALGMCCAILADWGHKNRIDERIVVIVNTVSEDSRNGSLRLINFSESGSSNARHLEMEEKEAGCTMFGLND